MSAEITLSRTNAQGIVITSIDRQPSAPPSTGVASSRTSSGLATSTAAISLHSQQPSSNQPQHEPFDPNDKIQNLCDVVKCPEQHIPPTRRRVGSISDSSGHNYHLFRGQDLTPATSTSTINSVKLAELFEQRSLLDNKGRVQLALMLAWGVLQMSSTSWLKGKWTRDNVLLIMDSTNQPVPYISHAFQSSRRPSRTETTLSPTSTAPIADWINNASLFALGIFMLEVCYNRSIEDLATSEEKQSPSHTSHLTAMRLSKKVGGELGTNYAEAIDACLRSKDFDLDAEGKPKDFPKYANGFMRDIIEPLSKTMSTFGN